MNEDAVIHRSHNVYILGAGFSYQAGLPLMKGFLDEMRESINWLEDAGNRERELKAITKVFNLRRRAAGSAYRMRINPENIEELFSLATAIDHDRPDYTAELEEDYVSLAIAATLDYATWKGNPSKHKYRLLLRNWKEFEHVIKKPGSNWIKGDPSVDNSNPGDYFFIPIYDFYAGLFSGEWCKQVSGIRNTVITFNYDTLLEESLHRLDIPFTYTFPNRFPIEGQSTQPEMEHARLPVLKLHGSVNWYIEPPSEEASTDEDGRLYAHTNYRDLLDSWDTPYLLPPTWRKIFSGSLAGIWHQSVKAIADATRITIIGFSLPPTDIHFRYLLAAGLQENISLRNMLVLNYAENEDQEKQVKKNFDRIFQPLFRKEIKWNFKGTYQAFGNPALCDSIERSLDPDRFGSLAM